jgi:hypothetical protein
VIKDTVQTLIDRIIPYYDNEMQIYIKNDLQEFLSVEPEVYYGNKSFKYQDGMLSGWKFTNIIESFINMYFCKQATKLMSNKVKYKFDHLFSIGNGDDNVTCIRLNDDISPDKFAEDYKQYIESFGCLQCN